MTTYGNTAEPGIVTTVHSADNFSSDGDAPSDLGIVGQARLDQGDADPNTVYEITRGSEARSLFGPEDVSLLTQGVLDAMNEGASPVYAVATEEDTNTEDISGVSSTSGTLSVGPVSEVAEDVTFTIGGSEAETQIVYDDPSTYSPASGEVYLNPVTGDFETNVAPSTGDDVQYRYYYYDAANNAMADGAGDVIDFLVPLSEREEVTRNAQQVVDQMSDRNEFAIALLGPDTSSIDLSTYTNPYDDSRLQVLATTRFEDGSSALAAYGGLKSALGLDRSAIGRRLQSDKSLLVELSRDQRSTLANDNVVPMADESDGARVTDDPTCVTDQNEDEQNVQYGFTRLLVDYVIEITRETEQPFIGRLNRTPVLNALEDLIAEELEAMAGSDAISNYDVEIRREDSVTASLDLNVEVVEPIRFIENTVTIGNQA